MFDENRNQGRGFAGMDEEKRREIASRGGQAAHAKGTAHEFDSEEGRQAAMARRQNQQSQNQMNQDNGMRGMNETGGQGGQSDQGNQSGQGGQETRS